MALSSKDKKLLESARLFKDKLEVLGCPYTEGVEESWILDLVFKPGEQRIRLLHWLFSKFDSRLHDLLDPHYVTSDSKMDSRIQRLLYVASNLGLCSSEDADLIRGVGSLTRQTVFMEHLLDLVYIMDKSEDPHARSLKSPGMVSEGSSLKEQFYSDCWFVDSLANQESMDSVLTAEARLLPPDITKQLDIAGRERAQCGEDPDLRVPDHASLEEMVNNFTQDLQRQEEILEEMKKMHPFPRDDAQSTENVQRTLRLALSELSQLVIGFSYCFDNEIRQWCNKSPPQLSELGPAFRRIHGLLEHFVKVLNGVSSVRTCHKSLCYNLPDKVKVLAEDHSVPRGDHVLSMVQDFQEHISVLGESLSRADSGASSQPHGRSVMAGLLKLR